MKRKQQQQGVADPESEPISKIVSKVELDLFADPLKQESIEHSYKMEYGPMGAITDSGPIAFEIPKSDKLFTDLGGIYLEVTLRVTKENGTVLDNDDRDKIQPCNNFLDALFSRVSVSINDTPVGSDGNFHPQISLIKNLLTYDYESLKSTVSRSIGWDKDYNYPVDHPQMRHLWIAESKSTTFLGKLSDNFLTTKNLMIPHVPISIVLHRSPAHFCLIREMNIHDTYKINIENCTLIVRRVKLNDVTFNHLEAQLARGAMTKYSYFDTVARTTQISIGSQHWRARNMFNGKLPTRVLLGICEHSGTVGGSWTNNPMTFPSFHYKTNYIQFYADERPLLKRPYRPNFLTGETNRSFMGLLETARVLATGGTIGISPIEFDTNYGLFGLDLTADGTNMTHMNDEKGNFDVEIGFGEPTRVPLCGFLVGEFPRICQIDKDLKIVSHYL
jgi:hypothetical protein